MPRDPYPIRITDDLGDELVLEGEPRRIVSLVPSITETVIELGAGRKLVGITNYCVHPEAVVGRIPKVGGTKGFHFDRIDEADPDLVIANKEENRKRHVERLRETYPVFVTYPTTVEQAMKTVLDLGRLTGTTYRASELAASCDHTLSSVNPSMIGPSLRTACLIWRDPWMAAGGGTYMDELLALAGFRNVFPAEEGRYPKTSLEAVAKKRPEVVMLPSEPYEFGAADGEEVAAFLHQRDRRARILLVDGSYLTWFGARTLRGLQYLLGERAKIGREAP